MGSDYTLIADKLRRVHVGDLSASGNKTLEKNYYQTSSVH